MIAERTTPFRSTTGAHERFHGRRKKKLIEVALRLEAINRESAGEVDPAWASLDAASVVGAAAAGGVPGGVVRVPGG